MLSYTISDFSSQEMCIVEYAKKVSQGNNDDYDELYVNFQILNFINENKQLIENDSFINECANKIPLLHLTKQQEQALSKAKTFEEQYKACQEVCKLKEGLYFDIKGNKNLEDLINSDDIKGKKISYSTKISLLLDILMGGAILDRAGIIQRDFNCENIQLDIEPRKKPQAYIIDLGKAIHNGIIYIFDNDESRKRDYCGPFYYSAPPEAYKEGFNDKDPYDSKNRQLVFGDKYNAFNIGLLMLPLFFDKAGQDKMYVWKPDEDLVKDRIDLFNRLNEIIYELNESRENPYNEEQLITIISIMLNLLNPDFNERKSAETVGRAIYHEIHVNHTFLFELHI